MLNINLYNSHVQAFGHNIPCNAFPVFLFNKNMMWCNVAL